MRQDIMDMIKNMPHFSDSLFKLMKLGDGAECSADSVIDVIKYDDRLTALVLKMVNSADFGLRVPVDSVKAAVTMLGFKRIYEVAQEVYTKMYLGKPLNGYESASGIWQHSVRTAIASAELAFFAKTPIDGEKAFTAGILHDIGKSVLSEFLGSTATQFVAAIDKEKYKDYLEAEDASLGTNHSEVGEALAREWHLPEYICQSIKYHHRPSEAPEEYRAYAFTIHLGDIIAMLSCSDQGADALLYAVDEAYNDYLVISDVAIYSIVMEVDDQMDKLNKGFSKNDAS